MAIHIQNGSFELVQSGDTLLLKTAFNPRVVDEAKRIHGKWNGREKAWSFSLGQITQIQNLLKSIFGVDGSEQNLESVNVWVFMDKISDTDGELFLFGRQVAKRWQSGKPVSLGKGVAVIREGFQQRGGGRGAPRLAPRPGTILQVNEVPRPAFESTRLTLSPGAVAIAGQEASLPGALPSGPPPSQAKVYWDKQTAGQGQDGFLLSVSDAERSLYRDKLLGYVSSSRFEDPDVYYANRLKEMVVLLRINNRQEIHRVDPKDVRWNDKPSTQEIAASYGYTYLNKIQGYRAPAANDPQEPRPLPWQMQVFEYAKERGANTNEITSLRDYALSQGDDYVIIGESDRYLNEHYRFVEEAVKSGKKVPLEVLLNYKAFGVVTSSQPQSAPQKSPEKLALIRAIQDPQKYVYLMRESNYFEVQKLTGAEEVIYTGENRGLDPQEFGEGALVTRIPLEFATQVDYNLLPYLKSTDFPAGKKYGYNLFPNAPTPQWVTATIVEVHPMGIKIRFSGADEFEQEMTYDSREFLGKLEEGDFTKEIMPSSGWSSSPSTPPINEISDESFSQMLTQIEQEPAAPETPQEQEKQNQEKSQAIAQAVQQGSSRVKYLPVSQCASVDTVIPAGMAFETQKALLAVQRQYGNLDDFVRTRLRYHSQAELCKAFSAEQIDALALAIANIERREAIIIGDMTGIGKGRIAAGVIRYAVLQGLKPVFLTEKPNLFSDMYRDLLAIGSEALVPFIVNSDTKANITHADGKVIYRPEKSEVANAVFLSGELPKEAGYVCATYSQFNSEKRNTKRAFLSQIARNNVMIMDESHNAGGESNIGLFLQGLVSEARGGCFLSATFAKRADNMPIYSIKTVMREANLSYEGLIEAIKRGGNALQEIVAANLVEAGQMIRRERSYEGISVTYHTLEKQKAEHCATGDAATQIIRDIIAFQTEHIGPFIKKLDKIHKQSAERAGFRKGTHYAGVDNYPFASKIFNIIDQLLFSIKAEAVADEAIKVLRENKKPVIAFKSTMGSFLDHMGYNVGDYVENVDFT